MSAHGRFPLCLRSALFAAALAAIVVALGFTTSPAAAAEPQAHAAAKHRSPSALAHARYRAADRTFVRVARKLGRCQRRGANDRVRCATTRRKLQRAGRRLAQRRRKVSRLARRAGSSKRIASQQQAPTVSADGQTLTWTKVAGVSTYVLARKVPGEAVVYSAVNGTTATPPAAPGVTVRYAVRTAVTASIWSPDVSIAYPGDPATAPAPDPNDPTAAPDLRVSGATLAWDKVADVTRYVLVAKVPGQRDRYWTVDALSDTPAAVPGATVTYSVRTDVPGSAWAPERTIAYPATDTTVAPAPAPAPSPAPSGGFRAGVVSGSAINWELPFVKALGARSARMEFSIETPAANLDQYVDAYARAGIRPLLLAGFPGRVPTVAEAQNLASWAARFGPGGTFWQGKTYPAGTAVTAIEFGNESSYSYQYSSISGLSNWASTSFYRDVAQGYALRFKDAHAAIKAANPNVGLLAVGDAPGNWSTWMEEMFNAVPDLGQRVAGWTIHPYGPNWQSRIDGTISLAAAQGAPSTIPLYVTELGIASDNGRCLSDNYGWNACMTYDQAGATLTQTISAMRSRYGARLRELYVYAAHDLKGSGSSTDREAYFGSLKLDGTAKGGLTTAVQSVLSANP